MNGKSSSETLEWQLGTWLRTTFENKVCYNIGYSDEGRLISVEALVPIVMAESNKVLCLSESRITCE